MKDKRAGFLCALFLLSLLPCLLLGIDKSKKAYELIYEDVQLLKKQLISLEEKLGRNAEDIKILQDQLREIQSLVRILQADQSDVQEELRIIPSQYQRLLDKLQEVSILLAKISEDMLVMKGSVPPSSAPEQAAEREEGTTPLPEKEKEEEKKEIPSEQTAEPSPPLSLSPQEIYNAAYSDYLRGTYDLAIQGFQMYRQHFPESPLADNALYWIGECYFSQRQFEEAINHFNDLILYYPQGDKVAAASLKKGISLAEQGKKDQAIVVFRLLISKYPLEEEAKIAQEKIKELTSK